MLIAFAALSFAVGLGACLAAGHLRRAALLHGVAGAAGLIALALGIRHGVWRGPFAMDALVLVAAAFAGGLWLYGLARRHRPRPGLLVMLHAVAGGLATLLLAGFVLGR